jgi:hypothetical protein
LLPARLELTPPFGGTGFVRDKAAKWQRIVPEDELRVSCRERRNTIRIHAVDITGMTESDHGIAPEAIIKPGGKKKRPGTLFVDLILPFSMCMGLVCVGDGFRMHDVFELAECLQEFGGVVGPHLFNKVQP